MHVVMEAFLPISWMIASCYSLDVNAGGIVAKFASVHGSALAASHRLSHCIPPSKHPPPSIYSIAIVPVGPNLINSLTMIAPVGAPSMVDSPLWRFVIPVALRLPGTSLNPWASKHLHYDTSTCVGHQCCLPCPLQAFART